MEISVTYHKKCNKKGVKMGFKKSANFTCFPTSGGFFQ